jgi:competence protein ComEC
MEQRISFSHGIIALVLAVVAVFSMRAARAQDGLLKIHFFDVGQGDAILIEAPNGNQILIDGGPDAAVLEKLGDTLPFFDRDIDMVVATHPHADHIAGLIKVLERYAVANIVKTNYAYDSPESRAWDATVKDEHANVMSVSAGTELDIGNGAMLTVLNPFPDTKPKDPNDSSIVLLLEYKEAKFLLTGDAGATSERRMLALPMATTVDILKVGHHGSSTATSESFLRTIAPQAAIISVAAKNIYHLPSESTLTRLAENAVVQYRTDARGDITVATDGATIAVTTTKH